MKHCYLILVLIFWAAISSAQTLEDDKSVLMALYNATNGPTSWKVRTGWDSPSLPENQSPCGWFGVTCENNRVTEINLNGNRLSGSLPTEIGNLSALKSLNLRGDYNGFQGYPFISGTIPASLGNLTNLEFLDLGVANFTGNIPVSLGNLIQLTHLDLSYIPFDEGFDPYGLLEGSIPSELGNLINLKYLNLSRQSLTGNIPAQLGQLINIESLDLSFNNLFTGVIPASFGNFTKLTNLNLSYRQLLTRSAEWGQLGGVIPDLSGIPTSAVVDISGNSFNFSGMESNISRLDDYNSQNYLKMEGLFPLGSSSGGYGMLYVEAGGTLANNTYKWYKDNVLVKTNVGNPNYLAEELGVYRVEVTNNIATNLTLVSDDYIVVRLPVTLVSFSGENKINENILTWKTTLEVNNKGFEIEKSPDAKSFETIGFVDGNGDTNENKTYKFLDTKPFAKTYYRLKQFDWDGKFEYSRIINVNRDNLRLSVYPNPARNEFFISGLDQGENIQIRNSMGKIILEQKVNRAEPVNISQLSDGLYLIKVGEETRKVVIQN